MEWDVPYEPTLIANVELYVPYYSDISPLFGVKWKQWHDSKGAEGEEPPDWAKELFDARRRVEDAGARVSDRWVEVGKRAGQAQPGEHDDHRHDRRAAEAGRSSGTG